MTSMSAEKLQSYVTIFHMDNSTGDAKVAKKTNYHWRHQLCGTGAGAPAWSLCTYTNLAISIYI